ncbi:MAG TPA: TIGR03435 family protein [Bryobacteraceae bacterium]|jgi:bla regulator protein BlaR1|nr:TIGR03435 family protein [Bryobacteraceae bacterium]
MTGLLNHLWQSTLFAILAGLLTLTLKRNSARTRYWVWFAASVKFFIPFSLLVDAGSRVEWRTVPVIAQPAVSVSIEQVFTAPAMILGTPEVARHDANYWPAALGAIWFCGFATVLFSWSRQWRRIRTALRTARPYDLPLPIKTMLSPTLLEPGIFGVFRPVLLLPEGIAERLMPDQLNAIVAHELCHVRSRDNLAAAVHMLVEAIFWFHPLVWWIGKRLVDERERACDEEVLRLGSEPEVYAESILKVCEFYLESPLDCVSGITGSDLRKRIRNIMTRAATRKLDNGKKLLLTATGLAAVVGPLVVGMMDAPAIRAQSASGKAPKFEVAAIHPAKQDNEVGFDTEKGHFLAHNVTLRRLIARAYDVDIALVSGGPKWIDSDTYDINAKIPEEFAQQTREMVPLMLQGLLADRFHVVFHRESSQVAGYALVVAKNGSKMERADPEVKDIKMRTTKNTHLIAQSATMEAFAKDLSRNRDVGKLVVDKTSLPGRFKFELDWAPERAASSAEPSSDDRPSIFAALQQQLGLKLESAKIPVSALAIDHAEKPSDNDQAFFRKAMWSPQAFEVASIKPAPPDGTERGVTQKPGGRLSTSNATVRQLVYLAYQVMPVQVSGGPDWVGSAGFDIEAKPAGSSPDRKQFRQMIQTLLADRFQLKFHMETKQLPIYELVVVKRGAKLTEDKSESLEVGMRNLRGELQGDKATMPMLAGSLTRVLQRQVVDQTGLKGAYSFRLRFLPDQVRRDDREAPDSDGASIFTALQEQLGLSLKASRGPVEVLVIDSAEKPSAN